MTVERIRERARRAGRRAAAVVRREVVQSVADIRTARPRTVVLETLVCLVVLALTLLPLGLYSPQRPALVVLEGVWMALLLLVRRRHPVPAVLGTGLLFASDSFGVAAAVPFVVLSATRRVAPRRGWQAVGVASAASFALSFAVGQSAEFSWPLRLAAEAGSLLFLLILPALAGTLLGRRRPLVSLLRERNAYLEQARSLSAAAARGAERNRIAGEMHDLLGHKLSLISVHAGALELAAERQAPALSAQAELLRTTAGTAMDELREILGVLRRDQLADPSGEPGSTRGTREDITALVDESARAGMAVVLDWSGSDTADASPRTRQAVHRVVREALTNALKHAPGAPTRVELRHTTGRIALAVTNETPRAVRPGPGTRSGLVGLEERIALLGGSFGAGPVAHGGFRVEALLPTHPETVQQPETAPRPDQPGHPAPHPGARSAAPGANGAGVFPPLSAETLTWPRLLGAGCAAAVVILPTVLFLVLLVVLRIVG
ncbi:histidine kinase [Streptomyces sp. NPDC093085]|uniref:sensor histidine kinase n=1 Tax=Streptomyces sp. NPDC093085 TaxID=3155068 RepID=UPI0034313C20